MDEVLQEANVIRIVCDFFEHILINNSKGPVVDEEALEEHLKHNPIFQVGLNVYVDEMYMKPGLADKPNTIAELCLIFLQHQSFQVQDKQPSSISCAWWGSGKGKTSSLYDQQQHNFFRI